MGATEDNQEPSDLSHLGAACLDNYQATADDSEPGNSGGQPYVEKQSLLQFLRGMRRAPVQDR